MNRTNKTRAALSGIGACSPALKWVNGHSPAEAWRKCNRPDWLLWLVGRLAQQAPKAETRAYYARAGSSAVAACIDVLVDSGFVRSEEETETLNGCYVPAKESYQYAIGISTLLDRQGQGELVKLNPISPWEHDACLGYFWMQSSYRLALYDLLFQAHHMVGHPEKGIFIENYGWFQQLRVCLTVRIRLAQEIRRVVERPTLNELPRRVRQ